MLQNPNQCLIQPPISPPLAAPGAGLPRLELLFARFLTSWLAWRASRTQTETQFREEKHRMLSLTKTLTPQQAGQPVLIRRLRGMEDSSRFWSVWMTLDHLRIVNDATAELISLLVQEKTPQRVVGTADVKPSSTVNAAVVDDFLHTCDRFEVTVAQIDDLNASVNWPHPWFGPMNAARWHFFTSFHMRLHRRQIECIVSKLDPKRATP